MSRQDLFLINVALLFLIGIALQLKEPSPQEPAPHSPPVVQLPPAPPPLKEEPKKLEKIKIEPVWTHYPPVRNVTHLGKVLSDIESHMPAGHHYTASNKITWAHETTHGINANIRNKYFQSGRKINAFYVLENRACIIEEPKTTIRRVAQMVPQSLRGQTYNLYLVKQAGQWNNEPLYLFDEWVAYTNGSACGKDLKNVEYWSEVWFMFEFNVYCLTVAQVVKQECPNYDDKQFKAFLMWQLERTMQIFQGEEKARAYWEKVKTSPDAENLRQFARSYLGAEWCKEVLGF